MQLEKQGASELLHWVARALSDYQGKTIAVAVSGGGDSMALLHLALRWAESNNATVKAVTVDHGLRDGSDQEAADVSGHCEALGVAHQTLVWGAWDGHGNLQARARDMRYQLIADWAAEAEVDCILLGHTRDDNSENFILRLSRKAGVDGLSSMSQRFERNGQTWLRPLLMAKRDALRRYLRENDLVWVDDPSNDNVIFDRVRVRHALETLDGLGISQDAIHQTSLAVGQARDALDYYVQQEAKARVTAQGGDLILSDVRELPLDVQRRLWSKIVQWMGRAEYAPRASSLQHLRSGVTLEGKATAGGCVATKDGTAVRFVREENAVRTISAKTTQTWDHVWQIDGPHEDNLEIRALGNGILECPDWREMGLPRVSLLASPAVWSKDTLIAAPIAGYANGWSAKFTADFHSWLVTH